MLHDVVNSQPESTSLEPFHKGDDDFVRSADGNLEG